MTSTDPALSRLGYLYYTGRIGGPRTEGRSIAGLLGIESIHSLTAGG